MRRWLNTGLLSADSMLKREGDEDYASLENILKIHGPQPFSDLSTYRSIQKNADNILKLWGKPKEVSPYVTMLLAFCRFVMVNKLMMTPSNNSH